MSTHFILNRAEGSPIQFAKLTPRGVIRFREIFREYRKQQLFQTLAMAGVTGMDAVKVLNDFDAKVLPHGAAIEWVNDPQGQAEVIGISLSIEHPGEDAAAIARRFDGLNLSIEELIVVACGVLNLRLEPVPKEGGESDPTTAASGQTETGGTKQTLSDTSST